MLFSRLYIQFCVICKFSSRIYVFFIQNLDTIFIKLEQSYSFLRALLGCNSSLNQPLKSHLTLIQHSLFQLLQDGKILSKRLTQNQPHYAYDILVILQSSKDVDTKIWSHYMFVKIVHIGNFMMIEQNLTKKIMIQVMYLYLLFAKRYCIRSNALTAVVVD